jgi:CRISPR-associated protein Csm5
MSKYIKEIHQLYNIHQLSIEILSPVSIGAGTVLSPYSDYILSENKVYYVNGKKVENALEKALIHNENIINDYTNSILEQWQNNSSRASLEDFITGDLGLDFKQFQSVESSGLVGKQEIAKIIREAGKPYFPGSSLKGAFSTALLYDWLMNTDDGFEEMETIYNIIDDFADYQVLKQRKKDTGRLSKEDFDRFCSLGKEENSNKAFVFDESHLFKYSKTNTLISQLFAFSDSQLLEKEQVMAYTANRIKLVKDDKDSGTPMPKEALKPTNSNAESGKVELRITKNKIPQDSPINYLNLSDTNTILKKINRFSEAFIDFELDNLTRTNNIEEQSALDALKNFYISLKNRLKNGEYLMRIGNGKTYYNNSLGLAILNFKGQDDSVKRESYYADFCKIFKIQEAYPTTRTVTSIGSLPFGWVKININN